MREIKFRAWCGNYFEYSEFNHKTGCMGCNFSVNTDEGKPIQQYTGLKDKNGVEVYEGDICIIYSSKNYPPVRVVECYTGAVTYIDGGYYLVKNNKKTSTVVISAYCNNSSSQDCEIIGNIYENPKLLKD